MTSKASGSRKLKRSSLPKFNHDIYSRISSRNLFVFSVHYLLEQEIEVRMEDIVFACFLLFPHKYALKKYPRWPDSAAVSRRLSDCRSKGIIAVNTDFGFKLTAKGSRLAEKVAKVLGVSTVKRAAKVPPPQQKEHAVAKEVKPAISKKTITRSAKIVQVISSRPKVHAATPIRKTKIVRKKKITSPAPMKKVQTSLPKVNVAIAQPVRKEKAILPAPIGKAQTSRSKMFPAKQAKKAQPLPPKEITPFKPVKKAQSIQPTTARPTTPAKKIKPLWTKKTKPSEPVVQPGKVEPTQLTLFKKANLPAPSDVPKEVKVRAGKFVHLMERSDAYIHYKKDGKNSKIGEFDFRSLLLCTMESSRETLAKNVELFKNYARIHNRQDLLTFLDHCEDRFSYLLVAPQKQLKRKSTRGREFHG